MTADKIKVAVTERLRELEGGTAASTGEDFDFSTPEAERALKAVASLLLEIRQDVDSRLARRVRLYERTLGLAVVPVLIRRAAKVARNAWLRRRISR